MARRAVTCATLHTWGAKVWVLLAAALAADPVTWIGDDGTVSGSVSVAAPPEAVVPLLRDAVKVAVLDGGSTRVTPVQPDGPCQIYDYVSASIIADIPYRVKQCPTADGLVSTLVSSPSFSTYVAQWRVQPDGTGSALRYDIKTEVTMLVPNSLVRSTARKAVRRMLDRLVERFGAVAQATGAGTP